MENSITTARAVADRVNNEHDHGLRARERRQPRTPGIFSVDGLSGTREIF